MTRKKSPPSLSLLEQIAVGMRYGQIPLHLAVTLSAPGVLERAWTEQPFVNVPFSDFGVPGRSRGASEFVKSTDFDGPNIYVEVLMYTCPQTLLATLQRLRESVYEIETTNQSDDLRAAEELQRAGQMQGAIHWATQVTRAMVGHVCGLNGNVVAPGPCSDAPIVTALRAIGPPTLEEIVAAAARQAELNASLV